MSLGKKNSYNALMWKNILNTVLHLSWALETTIFQISCVMTQKRNIGFTFGEKNCVLTFVVCETEKLGVFKSFWKTQPDLTSPRNNIQKKHWFKGVWSTVCVVDTGCIPALFLKDFPYKLENGVVRRKCCPSKLFLEGFGLHTTLLTIFWIQCVSPLTLCVCLCVWCRGLAVL